MKLFTKCCFIIVCVFTVCLAMVPKASADEWNKKTKVTFSAPVEVPGVGAHLLPAGNYVFKLLDSPSDRHIVQIFNEGEDHLFTTILSIPNYRYQATDKTVMTFKERAEGQPQAIRTWFYPGRLWGDEFVYPKEKAIALAKIEDQPVLYAPIEFASVEELKTAPILAVKPTGEDIPLAEVVEAPPTEVAQDAAQKEVVQKDVAQEEAPKTLPATASYLPLLAGLGFLSLCAARLIGKRSA